MYEVIDVFLDIVDSFTPHLTLEYLVKTELSVDIVRHIKENTYKSDEMERLKKKAKTLLKKWKNCTKTKNTVHGKGASNEDVGVVKTLPSSEGEFKKSLPKSEENIVAESHPSKTDPNGGATLPPSGASVDMGKSDETQSVDLVKVENSSKRKRYDEHIM